MAASGVGSCGGEGNVNFSWCVGESLFDRMGCLGVDVDREQHSAKPYSARLVLETTIKNEGGWKIFPGKDF